MYYIKKPIPVAAIKIPKNFDQELNWLRKEAPQWLIDSFINHTVENKNGHLIIKTLEGPMICPYGYWIIKGVHGEIYGCREDIFEETYQSYEGE